MAFLIVHKLQASVFQYLVWSFENGLSGVLLHCSAVYEGGYTRGHHEVLHPTGSKALLGQKVRHRF